VKELVENSLDANSTQIDVKFFTSGLNGFEVSDNGKGVSENDFESIAKRGTTSKIDNYSDVFRVKTLGFRGEALSSLCSLANLTISTKRKEWDLGWVLKYDHAGNLIEK